MAAISAPLRSALLVAVMSHAVAATAGQGVWTSLGGLPGGVVSALAIDSSTPEALYVSVGRGLFKSTDGGARWTSLAGGLPPEQAPDLLVGDPSRPGTLYARFDPPGRVFKTDDGGETWKALHGGPFTSLDGLAFSAGAPAAGYAFNNRDGRWYVSTDGGETWQRQGPPPFGFVSCIAIDPILSATVAVCADQLVYLTRDGGHSWTLAAMGLPDDDEIQGVVFDRQTPERLFAWAAYRGVFRSDDAGSNWRPIGLSELGGDIQGSLWALATAADGSRLYAGTSRSSDSGSEIVEIYVRERTDPRWRLAGPGITSLPFPPFFLAADPIDPLSLLAGTWGRGLAISRDGGTSWSFHETGFDAAAIVSLIADPRHPRVYYAGDVDDRVFRSGDDGASWQLFGENLGAILAIDPRRPRTLYAAGPSRSEDGGRHWTSLASGDLFACEYYGRLVIDPFDSTIYLLTQGNDYIGCHNPGSFLYKLREGRMTWETVSEPTGAVYDLAIGRQLSRPGASVLFALTYDGVERSFDGGSTWTTSTQGLGQLQGVTSMAVSADSRVLYLSGLDGVFRSMDGAVRWERTGALPPAPSNSLTLAVDPLAPETVYGYGGSFFFRSLNGGATWTDWSAGLQGLGLAWSSLAFDTSHPGRILGASEVAGVIEIELPTPSLR